MAPLDFQPLRDAQELRAADRDDARHFVGDRTGGVASGHLQALGVRQRRGNVFRPVHAVGDQGDVRADQSAQFLREGVIDGEPHRDPGDRFRGTHRSEEELVRPVAEHGEVRQVAGRARLIEQARQRVPPSPVPGECSRPRFGHAYRGRGRCLHRCAERCCWPHPGWSRASPLLRCDGLAEAEVARQHGHAAGQLAGAETDELLDERSAGTQAFGGTCFDVVSRTGKHCGQRHSLSDDHQSNDQYEKPFAETAHETDSNARADIVGAARPWPRECDRRNETFRTHEIRLCPGIQPWAAFPAGTASAPGIYRLRRSCSPAC